MPEDFLKSCEQHIINILGPVSILEAAGKLEVGGCDAEAKGGRLLKDKQASPFLTRRSRTFSLPSLLLHVRAAAALKGPQLLMKGP
jgi:hypothetical protein